MPDDPEETPSAPLRVEPADMMGYGDGAKPEPTGGPAGPATLDAAIAALTPARRLDLTRRQETGRAIEEMRRSDRLPGPASLTIGDVDDALRVIEVSKPMAPASPPIHDAWMRREAMLTRSPGFAMLRDWCQANLGVWPSTDALKTIISRLAMELRKPFDAVRSMPLVDAIRMLDAVDTTTGDDRQEAGGANEGKGEKTKPPTLDDLKATAWKLLTAVRDLKATDSEKAVGRKRITEKARTGRHDSTHNKEAFGQLTELELIKGVRRVGTWITQAGIDALNKRSING